MCLQLQRNPNTRSAIFRMTRMGGCKWCHTTPQHSRECQINKSSPPTRNVMTSVARTIHQTRVPERFGLRVPLGATIMPGILPRHHVVHAVHVVCIVGECSTRAPICFPGHCCGPGSRLPAEREAASAVFRWRQLPAQVRRPTLAWPKHVQLFEALSLDHLQPKT